MLIEYLTVMSKLFYRYLLLTGNPIATQHLLCHSLVRSKTFMNKFESLVKWINSIFRTLDLLTYFSAVQEYDATKAAKVLHSWVQKDLPNTINAAALQLLFTKFCSKLFFLFAIKDNFLKEDFRVWKASHHPLKRFLHNALLNLTTLCHWLCLRA